MLCLNMETVSTMAQSRPTDSLVSTKSVPVGWMKNVLLSIIDAGAPHFPDQGSGWETLPQTALHRLVKLCIEVPGMVP